MVVTQQSAETEGGNANARLYMYRERDGTGASCMHGAVLRPAAAMYADRHRHAAAQRRKMKRRLRNVRAAWIIALALAPLR